MTWLDPTEHASTTSDNLYLSREFDECSSPTLSLSSVNAASISAYGSGAGPVVNVGADIWTTSRTTRGAR